MSGKAIGGGKDAPVHFLKFKLRNLAADDAKKASSVRIKNA